MSQYKLKASSPELVPQPPAPAGDRSLCVYHVVYEPSYKSIIFHHWTECNLKCRGCYCQVEKLDFSLLPDWQLRLATNPPETPPEKLLSLDEALAMTDKLAIERAIFIGIEPSIDPCLPALAKALKSRHGAYNILFTTGVALPDLTDIDEVIMSLKAVTPELYRAYTLGDNRKTLANFRRVHDLGKRLQAEITLIPGVIDAPEVEKAAEFIASVDRNIPLRINGFIRLSAIEYRAPAGEEVEAAALLAKKHLATVNYLSGEMPRVGEPPLRLF